MSSASKQLVINSRERAVSDDVNRLQAFSGADLAEVLRNAYAGAIAAVGLDETTRPPSADASPNPALIFNGLFAQPQIASVDLLVTPGTAFVVDPELAPSTDDSPAHVIVDPGVALPGVLTFTANPAGSPRVDIVEFARVRSDRNGQGNVDTAGLVIETSNRDIYNTVTGVFAPATVNKVYAAGRLTYRIRIGTPGGGWPGTAAGWTPILVSSAAAGATTWNDCICWDVRPMSNDFKPREQSHASGVRRRRITGGNLFTESTHQKMLGTVEGQFDGFLIGGNIPATGYTFKNDGSFDDIATGTLAQGAATTTLGAYYVYAAFPFGLPRWMELSPFASGNRLGNGFRGIPVATVDVLPLDAGGGPSGGLPLPTSTGFSFTTTNAVVVAVGNVVDDGGGLQLISPPVMVDTTFFGGFLSIIGTPNAGNYDLNLSDGLIAGVNQFFPPGARKVTLQVSVALSIAAATSGTVRATVVETTNTMTVIPSNGAPGSTNNVVAVSNPGGAPSLYYIIFEVDLYLRTQYPTLSGPTTRTLQVQPGIGAGITVSQVVATVKSFEL